MSDNQTLIETQTTLAVAQTESASVGLVEGFPADARTWQTYGSATFGDDADDQGTSGGQDGAAVGLNLLLRWHYGFSSGWTVHMDGGAGMWQGTTSFSAGGTHFNFTPQSGVGITYNLKESMRLMAGTRWHHISNTDIDGKGNNPGHDGAMVYAGVMFVY